LKIGACGGLVVFLGALLMLFLLLWLLALAPLSLVSDPPFGLFVPVWASVDVVASDILLLF
jgi:hypothetical protein